MRREEGGFVCVHLSGIGTRMAGLSKRAQTDSYSHTVTHRHTDRVALLSIGRMASQSISVEGTRSGPVVIVSVASRRVASSHSSRRLGKKSYARHVGA